MNAHVKEVVAVFHAVSPRGRMTDCDLREIMPELPSYMGGQYGHGPFTKDSPYGFGPSPRPLRKVEL